MGMFDYVKYEAPCPKCGAPLTGWQSKDAGCLLETLEPWQVENFYTNCSECGLWVDATVKADIEHIVKSCEVTLDPRGCP